VHLTSQEWTVLVAFGGVVIGGALTIAGSLWLARSQSKQARQQAYIAARRDAYLEVLTWFALIRDGLRESIGSGAPWDADDYLTDRRGTAHVDALTEMYGSAAFREATSKWQPAFQDLLRAHDRWLRLADATPEDRRPFEPLSAAHDELQDRMADLTGVLLAIQEVARREAGGLAAHP
jgi:hypothetical protein